METGIVLAEERPSGLFFAYDRLSLTASSWRNSSACSLVYKVVYIPRITAAKSAISVVDEVQS